MYKARIAKWGLDKKIKESEAWAILRMKAQRDAVGINSAFRVRGKPVNNEDVLRYFRRKGMPNPEAVLRASEISYPPTIECLTPYSSPRHGHAAIPPNKDASMQWATELLNPSSTEIAAMRSTTLASALQGGYDINTDLSTDETQAIVSLTPKMHSSRLPISLLPPRSLLVHEKLFVSIKTYYSGAFDNGLFQPSDSGYLGYANDERDSQRGTRVGRFL